MFYLLFILFLYQDHQLFSLQEAKGNLYFSLMTAVNTSLCFIVSTDIVMNAGFIGITHRIEFMSQSIL